MPMLAPVASISDLLDETANDSTLDPAERISKLRVLRADLSSLLGQADRYIGDGELEREGRGLSRVREFMESRSRADARGGLLDAGLASPETLDAAGVLSHVSLSRQLADGSIEEAIIGVPIDPVLQEAWSEAARAAALAARQRNRQMHPGLQPGSHPRPSLRSEGYQHELVRDAKPMTPKLAKAAAAAGAHVPEPAAGGMSMADIEKMGLNEWPKPGEVAKKLLRGAKDTQELHSAPGAASPGAGGGVVYSAARKPVHDRIVGGALSKPAGELLGEEHAIVRKLSAGGTLNDAEKDTIRKAAAAARGGGKPEALFMAGGSASGKSSALKEAPHLVPHAAVHIDPDAFKEQLPEYQHMMAGGERFAAAGVHEESADLAKRVQAESRDLHMNMLVDGTGDSGAAKRDEKGKVTEPGKFAKKLIDANQAGYHVKSLYVTVPTDTAVQRSVKRAGQTGRFVPVPEVRTQHRNVSRNFPEISALPFVHDLQVFDTAGNKPKLIASGARGRLTVHHPAEHQAFVEKAHE